MLTKKQFLERLNFIIDYDKKVEKFDGALKEFAHSDFTGYYDEDIHIHLLNNLVEDMNVPFDDDIISWWLYDCPQAGKCTEHCRVWDGDPDDPNTIEYDLTTPEKLYEYIFITYSQTPSKDTIKSIIKAQDSGVKFALQEIQDLRKTNNQTRNEGWEDRDILFKFTQSQIENQYRLKRGIGADLNLDNPLYIISILDEES